MSPVRLSDPKNGAVQLCTVEQICTGEGAVPPLHFIKKQALCLFFPEGEALPLGKKQTSPLPSIPDRAVQEQVSSGFVILGGTGPAAVETLPLSSLSISNQGKTEELAVPCFFFS